MNTQEIIAALAAELTRLNKMPVGIDTERCTVEESWSRTYVHSPEIVLAALSGVAAELCANERITIVKTSRGYHPFHYLIGFFGYLPTIHEALIAALKQIKEVKK